MEEAAKALADAEADLRETEERVGDRQRFASFTALVERHIVADRKEVGLLILNKWPKLRHDIRRIIRTLNIEWLPPHPTLENYIRIFGEYPVLRWGINSVVVAVISTALSVFSGAMAGYALARLRFPGRDMLRAHNFPAPGVARAGRGGRRCAARLR